MPTTSMEDQTTICSIEREDLRDARITAMSASGVNSFQTTWSNGDTVGIRKEVKDLCLAYFELGIEHGIRNKKHERRIISQRKQNKR